jgi:hypothetical protein
VTRFWPSISRAKQCCTFGSRRNFRFSLTRKKDVCLDKDPDLRVAFGRLELPMISPSTLPFWQETHCSTKLLCCGGP